MDELIENFLLQNSYCPLPQLGTLVLKQESAAVKVGENIMSAPVQKISLTPVQKPTEKFVEYIAQKNGTDSQDAAELLMNYCQQILNLGKEQEIVLNQSGIFFITPEGQPGFRQKPLPAEFTPQVKLRKVIHPNRVHKITIGDKERSTTFTSETSESGLELKSGKWWIWAAALALLGVAAVVYYQSFLSNDSGFGNAGHIQPSSDVQNYKLVN